MLRRRLAGLTLVAAASIALAGNGVVPPQASSVALALAPTAVQLATQQIGTPTMQPVNLPARPVRVAVVPGSGGAEAWAIGYSSAMVGGWNSGGLGQSVFLHYTTATGWQISGPPLLPSGQASPARLSALAVAANGEGWAVGAGGALVHHSAGDSAWRVASSGITAPLTSVSLAPDGSGYAVGSGFTVLRLAAGSSTWVQDTAGYTANPNLGCPSTAPDLAAVAAVDAGTAWAVTGETSSALCVLHRTGGTWNPVSTEAQFMTPSGPPNNQAASGGGVALASSGVWVVGRMEPTDTSHPLGDAQTGDLSRPFAIWIPQSGSPKSYCPTVATVDSNKRETTEQLVCDASFPLAAFGLTGVVAFGDAPDGEAFATGMGLFHFVHGAWEREPDAIGYLTSLSMASPQEGWMAGTGSNAITGAALSESMVIGHWTRHPAVPAMARWPEPGTIPLEGAAMAPDGSGTVLAVGADGHRARYVPGFGWDLLTRGNASLHAISWPVQGSAWAVGTGGSLAHWDGHSWTESAAPRNHATDPMTPLYGVAFADAGHGWAVGDNGVLLDFAGGWQRDPLSSRITTQPLYAVAYGGGSAAAGGAGGLVLTAQGATWAVDRNASALAGLGSESAATIYAAASLPDGTVALGGTHGLLLVRAPGGAFTRLEPGVDGTIVALALARDSAGRLEVLASVSPRAAVKYVNGTLSTTDGFLMARDAAGWHDLELNHQITMWTSTDTAAAHDPVYAFAMEPGTLRGWAVGGYPALALDDDNQSAERATSTGSVYRVDVTSDPSPPSSLLALPAPPSSGFTFAFLGDSACAAGVCGAALGSGAKADAVFQEAQREIDMVGPDLAVIGGNVRGLGRKEELDVFRRMLQGFAMPVFGAVGTQDRAAVNPNDTAPQAGEAQSAASQQSGQSVPTVPIASTDIPYLQTFSGQDTPWGSGGANAPGVHPVADSGSLTSGESRSHYAFDYQPQGGAKQVRFIVLNDSNVVGANNALTDTDENPNDDQSTWLANQLMDAHNHGLQAIVIMSAPSVDPRIGAAANAPLNAKDAGTVNTAVSSPAAPAAAVFASQINGNLFGPTLVSGNVVPVTEYISGGAGSPLEGTRSALQGYYHAWLLVTVDADHLVNGVATVKVRPMPVLESVAMRLGYTSSPGTLPSGNAVQVYGLGRLPDAGIANINGAHADETQSKADYLQVPPDNYGGFPCTVAEAENCTVGDALPPDHQFWVDNPKGCDHDHPDACLADFVQPCPTITNPLWPCTGSDGRALPDDQSGYLCTFHPGKVWINVRIGIHVARQQLTITRGRGACNEILPPLPPPAAKEPGVPDQPLVSQPQPQPAPVVRPAPAHRPHIFHTFTYNLVPAVLPPPVPVLAAAPPLPAAGTAAKKEEERERAFQHSSEQSGHGHHAMMRADADAYWDPRPVAAAGAGALLFLIVMSAWAVGRREPRGAFDERRWE